MEKFKKREIVEKLGIPSRRLQFITDQGLLSDTEKFPGRGKDRFYSRINIFEILLVEELNKYGFPTGNIKNILQQTTFIKGYHSILSGNDDLPGMFLIVSDDGSVSSTIQRDFDTMKPDDVIKIDMVGKISVFIINIKALVNKAIFA